MSIVFLQILFSDYDADKNNKLSRKEILPRLYCLLNGKTYDTDYIEEIMPQVEKDMILNLVFDLCDTDGDNELNFSEFVHFSKCFEFTKKIFSDYLFVVEVQALFNSIDFDLSGKISKAELDSALVKIRKSSHYDWFKKDFEKLEIYASNVPSTEPITANDFLLALVRKDILKEYKQELYSDIFNTFDANGNGTLDEKEISYMINTLFAKGVNPSNIASLIIQLLDKSEEGEIKLSEIIPFFDALDELDLDSKVPKGSGKLTLDMALTALFKITDENHDGLIDHYELEQILNTNFFKTVPEDKKKEIFAKVEQKSLNFDEFKEFMAPLL